MKRILLITFSIFLLTSCVKQLMIKEYYKPKEAVQMFGQTTERNFYYPVTLPDSLELKWDNGTKGSFANNSVLVEDNYVYVTDLAGSLYCFYADTGKTVGADKGSGEIPVAPVLNNGLVYFVKTLQDEPHSNLIRYDVRRGERFKEIEIKGKVSNELLKFGENIFLINDFGIARMYDIYLREIWETDLETNVYSSPAATDGFIYVATHEGEIVKLSQEDGKIIYRQNLSAYFESAISIKNQKGFIGDSDGNLIAFNLEDGSIIWSSKTYSKIKTAPVFNDRFVYISNLGGSVYCFNQNDGSKIWKFDTDGVFNTVPALFENVLLQPDLAERIFFIDPINGNLIKQWDFEERVKLHPLYFNEMLFIGIDRGELLTYKLVRETEE